MQIKIKTNEPGRTFQYIIYTVTGSGNATVLTTYKNWTSFSNSSIIISGLEKDDYRIQVRDNKNCYAE